MASFTFTFLLPGDNPPRSSKVLCSYLDAAQSIRANLRRLLPLLNINLVPEFQSKVSATTNPRKDKEDVHEVKHVDDILAGDEVKITINADFTVTPQIVWRADQRFTTFFWLHPSDKPLQDYVPFHVGNAYPSQIVAVRTKGLINPKLELELKLQAPTTSGRIQMFEVNLPVESASLPPGSNPRSLVKALTETQGRIEFFVQVSLKPPKPNASAPSPKKQGGPGADGSNVDWTPDAAILAEWCHAKSEFTSILTNPRTNTSFFDFIPHPEPPSTPPALRIAGLQTSVNGPSTPTNARISGSQPPTPTAQRLPSQPVSPRGAANWSNSSNIASPPVSPRSGMGGGGSQPVSPRSNRGTPLGRAIEMSEPGSVRKRTGSKENVLTLDRRMDEALARRSKSGISGDTIVLLPPTFGKSSRALSGGSRGAGVSGVPEGKEDASTPRGGNTPRGGGGGGFGGASVGGGAGAGAGVPSRAGTPSPPDDHNDEEDDYILDYSPNSSVVASASPLPPPSISSASPTPVLSIEDIKAKIKRYYPKRGGGLKNPMNQQQFRMSVKARCGNKCVVTGCYTSALLEATHIDPWNEQGSVDATNGVLLRIDLQRAFERGLLNFLLTEDPSSSSAVPPPPPPPPPPAAEGGGEEGKTAPVVVLGGEGVMVGKGAAVVTVVIESEEGKQEYPGLHGKDVSGAFVGKSLDYLRDYNASRGELLMKKRAAKEAVLIKQHNKQLKASGGGGGGGSRPKQPTSSRLKSSGSTRQALSLLNEM